MPQTHEWMFYEVAWRTWERGQTAPLPWWVQQYFRRWSDAYDSGLFDSKEAAFASNAHYRYWNMVGVKDHHQESLVGQGGEVEPVYDKYALGFFLFDPDRRVLHLPQMPEPNGQGPVLTQQLEADYLPVILTTYRSPLGVEVSQKVLATTLGERQRTVVLDRLMLQATDVLPKEAWLCLVVTPVGPSGFQRHDRAGRYLEDGRVTFLRYRPDERRVEVNATWGPIFDEPPDQFGCYGNLEGSYDPDHYIDNSPFHDLVENGSLNGLDTATDHVAGMCTAAFAWPFELTAQNPTFALDVKLPTDEYRGPDDLAELHAAEADDLESANRAFWTRKLDSEGLQASLPPSVEHLFDLFRFCRATLIILTDEGEIHPGPTIYDSFWVRDSSVEGIAAALAGDSGLAERQFGIHYPQVFSLSWDRVGPVSSRGFFGSEHEKNDHEWDSNGQALWALGRLDRILGPAGEFGARMFSPYVVEGARWLRDNRSPFGLLHSGWSAEHIGDKDKPHYWDDLWGLAGLYEAARMAERLGAQEEVEIWAIFDDLKRATRDSILWALDEQRRRGLQETFIPTGPADVGRLDSTMVGTLAYFHPCRLYMGAKLGDEVDQAARATLETIWDYFVEGGGFRHDAAWHAYGPYLTLQLAHAFLFSGDLQRMDECLRWSVGAARARVSRRDGDPTDPWQVVLGAWNEQHCYPVAKDFAEVPDSGWWYMGDIPHGWAAAEFNLLLRDILFFEADEDGDRHIYLAPGVLPHWVSDGQSISVNNAPTIFGGLFGYRLSHDAGAKRVDLEILQRPPEDVRFVYPSRFGSGVAAASADGADVPVNGRDVQLPAGTRRATVRYEG